MSNPAAVLVTSLMTYWYPGVKETVETIRSVFPDTPLILGGIYATLCACHAEKTIGADRVISGAGIPRVFELIREFTGHTVRLQFDPGDLDTYSMPAFDLRPFYSNLFCATGRHHLFTVSDLKNLLEGPLELDYLLIR